MTINEIGWPKEKQCVCDVKVKHFYCSCGYMDFNESLYLCKIAATKESRRVSRGAIEKIVQDSTLAGYAKNDVWTNDLVVELLELINRKEA